MSTKIALVAPARICLFGDHQDYLGLPIIACAINKHITLTATENNSNQLIISLPNIQSQREIDISDTFDTLEKGDHFASAIRVIRRYGAIIDNGWNITISGNIPINAGVSSSSHFDRIQDGAMALKFRGIEVKPMWEWQAYANQYLGLADANLVLYTTKQNFVLGTDILNPANQMKMWYDDIEEKFFVKSAFYLGFNFKNEEFLTVAY